MKTKPLWPEAIVWGEPDGSVGLFCWSEEQANAVEPIGNLVISMAEVWRNIDTLRRSFPHIDDDVGRLVVRRPVRSVRRVSPYSGP